MIPLSSANSSGFTWSKLPRNCGFEVKLNGSVVGALRRMSCWSSSYEAITSEGTFKMQRRGWSGTKAVIVDSVSQRQIALFESGWRRRSTLTFADGQRFQIERKGCWRPQWSIISESGERIVSLDLRQRTGDTPVAANVKNSRLALLVMFTLYRIRQAEEDASAAAVVAAIAASS